MYDDQRIEFRIDAFTPETIPMHRLAQYLSELSKLFSNKDKVHFTEMKKGSAIAVMHIEYDAVPKVNERLRMIGSLDASKDIKEALNELNSLLANDNAVGSLSFSKDKIIEFPGREAMKPLDYGAVTQTGSLTGIVVRIGGTDKTIPVHLQDVDGQIWKCDATVEQSEDLATHYRKKPIRVYGDGRWIKDENGEWQQKGYFRISSFEVLNITPLNEFIHEIQNEFGSSWGEDPLKLMKEIRYGQEIEGDQE